MKKVLIISGIISAGLLVFILTGMADADPAEDFTAAQFLNAGNIFFRAGEAIEDEQQRAQCYIQALGIYYEGILKFPQDVPLKYNYETVKEKLEEILENTEQESEESGEGEEGEESEGENAEGEEGEEGEFGEMQEDESDESPESDEPELDMEAIERILQMLENQEEESLKNNQEIIDGGSDKNGW